MAQPKNNQDSEMKDFLEAIDVMDDYVSADDDMIDPTELDYDNPDENDEENQIEEDNEEQNDNGEEQESDEEGEEEDEVDDDTEDDNEEQQDEDITPQEAVYELLREEGVLDVPDDFEFDGTPEGLKKALDLTKQNITQAAIESLLSKLPDDFKAAIKYGLSGGSSLYEFVKETLPSDEIDDLDKISLDSVANQRKVLKAFYRATTKYNDKKIDKLIDRIATDEDELLEEAEEALTYLKEYRKEQELKKIQEIERRKAEEQERIKQFRDSVSEAVSNLQATNARRKQIKEMILTPIEDEQGNVTTQFQRTLQAIYSNPEHLAQLANILADYSSDKGLTLDGIKLKGGSEAIKNFQKKLDRAATAARKVRKRSPKTKKPEINLAEVFKNL